MIFQLGIKKQKKFVKMNKHIQNNDMFLAALEMKNSLWYKQTPKRVDGLINLLLKKNMKKKDKEAFLRSITGTKPIQKKNNIKKSILKNENLNTRKHKNKKKLL